MTKGWQKTSGKVLRQPCC